MPDVVVERALYRRQRNEGPRLVSRSTHFPEHLLPNVDELLVLFGERPPGVACSHALFAQPLGERHVAVVQVADAAADESGWAGLQYSVLVLAVRDYEGLGGDPFEIARRFPLTIETAIQPARSAFAAERLSTGGDLEPFTLPAEPLSVRGLDEVRAVLKRIKANALPENADPNNPPPLTADNAQSPSLLGGVQVLVDGGKLVFERPKPDTSTLAALWTLLPHSLRPKLWPATFAFSNDLGFDVLVVPRLTDVAMQGYTTETQAEEYPQGSYELNLQIAAETGNARELENVFHRRTSNETLRLGVKILVAVSLVVLIARFLPTPSSGPDVVSRAATAAGIVGIHDPWAALEMLDRGNRVFLER